MKASDLTAHRTPGQIEAEILMKRSVHPGSFLLVEGPDDSRFFRPRIDSSCEIVICGGKLNVLGALARLDQRSLPGMVAVVDGDLDALTGRMITRQNCFVLDAHDLECMLLRSPALDSVLAEYGEPSRIQAFEIRGLSVRDALLHRGLPFGRLRWAADCRGWSLKVDSLRARFVDGRGWTVNQTGLIEAVSQDGSISAEILQDTLAELPSADPWSICHGHDLLDILVVGLKGVLGSTKSVDHHQIARVLRQAMDSVDFASTAIHQQLRDWEQENQPYVVLKR